MMTFRETASDDILRSRLRSRPEGAAEESQSETPDPSFLGDGHKMLNDGKVFYGIYFLLDELWRLKKTVPAKA